MDFTYVNQAVLVLAVGMLLFVVVAVAISVANATLRANKNARQIKLLKRYDEPVIAGEARAHVVHLTRAPFVGQRVDPRVIRGYQERPKKKRHGKAPTFFKKPMGMWQ